MNNVAESRCCSVVCVFLFGPQKFRVRGVTAHAQSRCCCHSEALMVDVGEVTARIHHRWRRSGDVVAVLLGSSSLDSFYDLYD